ncbi:MAG: manganese transporter [Treponema sp.]|nr:MAG: manganese transporter [Treponema sp.]
MSKKIMAGFLFIYLLILTSCFGKEVRTDEVKKPLVVTTIGMIGDAVENIAGDKVLLKNLMGAGVDPHLYKATAGDVKNLNKADLILYSGLHLEGKMSSVLHKLENSRYVVAVSETIPVNDRLTFEGSEFDPHVWFDIKLWQYSVKSVYDSLCKLLPEDKDFLTDNYLAYKVKLDKLDAYITKQANSLPKEKRVLITAHDAFSYFSKAYDFKVMGIQGVSTVTEASSKDIQDLAAYIAENQIPAIFIESSVPHKTIEALQEAVKSRGYDVQIGGELFSDAMGNAGTVEGTYIGMLTHNIDTIVSALSK